MKLYTEEQVRKVWKAGQEYWKTSGTSITLEELLEYEKPIELPTDVCVNCDESKSTHNICMDCIIKMGIQNIQLPTDEEIRKQSTQLNYGGGSMGYIQNAFSKGAKWVIEQIKQQ